MDKMELIDLGFVEAADVVPAVKKRGHIVFDGLTQLRWGRQKERQRSTFMANKAEKLFLFWLKHTISFGIFNYSSSHIYTLKTQKIKLQPAQSQQNMPNLPNHFTTLQIIRRSM